MAHTAALSAANKASSHVPSAAQPSQPDLSGLASTGKHQSGKNQPGGRRKAKKVQVPVSALVGEAAPATEPQRPVNAWAAPLPLLGRPGSTAAAGPVQQAPAAKAGWGAGGMQDVLPDVAALDAAAITTAPMSTPQTDASLSSGAEDVAVVGGSSASRQQQAGEQAEEVVQAREAAEKAAAEQRRALLAAR
jgi:hypothetical protein